jgi:hypothetical protein
MRLKEFNLKYNSNNIEIHSLKNSDMENFVTWYRKWDIIEEYREKISDDEIINMIYRGVRKSIFFDSRIFIIERDNDFMGSFSIWHDDTIRFNVSDYKNKVYNINFHFIEKLNKSDISTLMRVSIEALYYFNIKIKTLYASKLDSVNYLKNFFDNGFEELEMENFYSKLEKYLIKRGLPNVYKNSSILIKNM